MSTAHPRPAQDERLYTLVEFARLPEEERYHLELRRGRLVREPRGGPARPHAAVAARLIARLDHHASERSAGTVLGPYAVLLSADPATVLVPDISFIATGRIPPSDESDEPFPPDLVVEVVSPGNTVANLQEKVLLYLAGGVRLVWLVDPRTRSVTVYRSTDDIHILTGAAVLEGGDALPGFRLALAELFRL